LEVPKNNERTSKKKCLKPILKKMVVNQAFEILGWKSLQGNVRIIH
jgi:hypothetical protein